MGGVWWLLRVFLIGSTQPLARLRRSAILKDWAKRRNVTTITSFIAVISKADRAGLRLNICQR